jgi:hypothetical protein
MTTIRRIWPDTIWLLLLAQDQSNTVLTNDSLGLAGVDASAGIKIVE